MSTRLVPAHATFPDIRVPNPGEPVRAGGGIGTLVEIEGDAGDDPDNGGVVYAALAVGVRVRHLGGISQTLDVTTDGSDITVQLGTDGAGAVTSDADAVVTKFNTVAAALANASYTGDGTGLAGEESTWTKLSNGTKGSVRPPLQVLTDRTQHLAERSPGRSMVRQVYSTNGADILIRAWTSLGELADPDEATFSPSLAALSNVWRYVYAYDNSGVIGYEMSGDGPDGHLRHKSGDTTRWYVCAVRINLLGTIVPFYSSSGTYVYDGLVLADSAKVATDTNWHDLDLSIIMPPHARHARLLISTDDAGSGASRTLSLRRKGSSATSLIVQQRIDNALLLQRLPAEIVSDGSQVTEYKFSASSGSVETSFYGVGWHE